MRVVLVTHPCPTSSGFDAYIPMGLVMVGTVLSRHGFSVKVVDVNRNPAGLAEGLDRVAERILEGDPAVVGLGSICTSYPLTLRLAERVKCLAPNVVVLLGGPQATATAEATLARFKFVDAIAVGEAEVFVAQAVERLVARHPLTGVAGMAWRDGERVVVEPRPPLITDLDGLPSPDWSLFPDLTLHRSGAVEAGRGCPFGCSFCSTTQFWERRFRLFSPERVADAMAEMKRFGFSEVALIHDLLTPNSSWVEALCDRLTEGRSTLTWGGSTRPNAIGAALAKRMRNAGCRHLYLGVESGSSRMQMLLNKRLPTRGVATSVAALREVGIDCTTSFVIGFPGEEKADMTATLEMMLALACRSERPKEIQLHRCTPLSGSTLAQSAAPLAWAETDSIASFAVPLDASMRAMVRDAPELFHSFYSFVDLALDDDHLAGLVMFGRWLTFFPYSSFLGWRLPSVEMVDRLLSDPALVAPLAALRHLEMDRATECAPEAMVKVFDQVFAKLNEDWPIEVARYEAFVHQLRKTKPHYRKAASAAFTVDPAAIISSITANGGPWQLPEPPCSVQTAYIGWFENEEPKLRRIEGRLVSLLQRLS